MATTNTAATEFVVRTSAAKMPNSCCGTYRHVAVMEVELGTVPSMISERARGVIRIVEIWERLSVGTTSRCAYERALTAASNMADELNAAE